MTPSQEPSGALGRWTLLAVLVLAAVLRVWGIGFGLPNLNARPDEIEVVSRAIRLLSGDLNPHFFHYPSLYFYLLGIAFAVWSGVSVTLGSSMEDFLARAAVDPSGFILVARYVTALAGVATVYGVYRVGSRLQGPSAGLAAATLLAVAHLHVRESHFATTDTLLTLLLIVAVYYLLEVAEEGTLRSYLWAGLFTGLAISTKYVGLILPWVLLLAHGLYHRRVSGDANWRKWARAGLSDPRLWLFGVTGAGAFFVTSPYAALDWALFTNHFNFQLNHLSGGHGVDLGNGGIYHLRHTLP
ncbi:MAG: glycosyltransferase family 39 protein [Longimicrobiales bacterium]|nr:glycosyltransferase family 39 protein [Longimicrobiales bacterium]